jgi:hypothetical protein
MSLSAALKQALTDPNVSAILFEATSSRTLPASVPGSAKGAWCWLVMRSERAWRIGSGL